MKLRDVWFFICGMLSAIFIGMVADGLPAPHGAGGADTVLQWRLRYLPAPAETIRVVEPGEVDTQYVVREYYTQKVYRDTIVENDTVQLVVCDTVFRNAMGERQVSLKVNPEVFRKHPRGNGRYKTLFRRSGTARCSFAYENHYTSGTRHQRCGTWS